jgi:hypothetical protein
VAAVVAGVVLVHGLLLVRWAGPGLPASSAAPPMATVPATTPVRSIVPLRPVAAAPAEPAPAPAAEAPPEPRLAGLAPAAPRPAAPPQVPRPAVGDTPEPVADPGIPAVSTAALAPAPSPAPATGQAEAVPLYAAALPPPFEAEFRLRRGALAGRASWSYAAGADSYQLSLQTRGLGREVGHLRSEGRRGPTGLEPLRFVEGRRGRDQRAVNFQREAGGGRISFSGPAVELPLPAGVQDRLSWLLQLAAIVDADPALRERGAEVSMWVVGPRGDADVWTFVAMGLEPVSRAEGTDQPALALRRDARRPWDTEVRVWLDPAARHLPLRAAWRIAGPDAESGIEIWRETLTWR